MLNLEVGMDIDTVKQQADTLKNKYENQLIYEQDARREYTNIENACYSEGSDAHCVPRQLPNRLSTDASGRIADKAMRLLVLGGFPYGFSQSLTIFYDDDSRQIKGWVYSD